MQSVYILQNNSYYDVLLNSIMKSKKNISIAIFSFNVSDEEDHKLEVRNLTKLLCQKKQEGELKSKSYWGIHIKSIKVNSLNH
ncbi:MAG: hypothetical protein IPP01_04920 [Saprospiraceae bacterium]|nr:hypothetical protein [Saprospiraceae bacterium]